ncbi:Predicted phosphodiesterase [Gracilimonas mengyeensis]|uniref:Predicted phosphodiesterase n=2 Tax=Gracilimonas mengyeensis TaxID=1302730 RepID=A0A521BZW9_9BACT|nr:Predicted phosphodiesterase [Gracilimonas mengyeensis]
MPALKAVLKALDEKNPEVWICLGDLVGYGPHPDECINEIRKRDFICVKGNHDAGITGELSKEVFRQPNRKVIDLSEDIVSEEQKKWVRDLPLIATNTEGDTKWIAAHASPVNPSKWEYLESAFKMRPMLAELEQQFCFIGHTHRPALVSEQIGINKFQPGLKYFINPGSVGQSRDGDYRASCAFLDTEKGIYENIRVEYEMEGVLSDLQSLGFSRREAEYLLKV